MTTAIAKYKPIELEKATIDTFDNAITKAVEIDSIKSHAERMLVKANTRIHLSQIFEDPQIKTIISSLQNTRVGFLTDNEQGYDYPVIRECAIEALLHGVSLDGNEFNIIKKNCYITKEGMTHKLNTLMLKGLLVSYVYTPGIPEFTGKVAVVKAKIEWLEPGNSKPKSKDLEFQVKSYGNMDADYVNGKGEKRAKSWLYETITGRAVPVGEANVINITAKEVPEEEKEPTEAQKAFDEEAQKTASKKKPASKKKAPAKKPEEKAPDTTSSPPPTEDAPAPPQEPASTPPSPQPPQEEDNGDTGFSLTGDGK